jgi:replicative DNA helicase
VEQALLRVLMASPAWRQRAAGEFTAENFDVPAHRAIFMALAALPGDADAADAAAVLPEDALAVFARLREAASALGGLDLDREYEGAAEKLRDRAEFRRLTAVEDPAERRRIMALWTAQTKERYAWLRAAQKSRRARRQ